MEEVKLKYFSEHLSELSGEGGVKSCLVFVWGFLWSKLDGFAFSNTVFWVTLFWGLDLILGSWLAWREHRFSPSRATRSILKWLLWVVVLVVAWGIRDLGFWGSVFVAKVIEGAVILAEATSVLRNAASLSDNPRAKKLMNRFADVADKKLDELEQRLSKVESKEMEKIDNESRESRESKPEKEA